MHVNYSVIGNSFCMTRFCRPLRLTLPRALNVLRLDLLLQMVPRTGSFIFCLDNLCMYSCKWSRRTIYVVIDGPPDHYAQTICVVTV